MVVGKTIFLLKRSLSREKLLILGRVVTGNFLLTLHFVLFPPIFSTPGFALPPGPQALLVDFHGALVTATFRQTLGANADGGGTTHTLLTFRCGKTLFG